MALELLNTIVSKDRKMQPMQASKWMHVRMLVSPMEFEDLLMHLEEVLFINISSVGSSHSIQGNIQEIKNTYALYIQALQEGTPYHSLTKSLCWALSKSLDPFYLINVSQDKWLVKQRTPAIRMQHFHFHYIHEQSSFVLTHHAERSISWGLEFSFPQFYQDPESCLPVEILKDHSHPNTRLFKQIQQWSRNETVPAAFIIDGHKKVAPFKLGRKCFSWIEEYLKGRELHVYRSSDNRQ